MRDVYVEGPTDVGFIRWFLDERAVGPVGVFSVSDRVLVGRELLEQLSLTSGEKQRVQALAIMAHRTLAPGQRAVTCIVDADLDHLIGPLIIERSCLITTEVPSLESYVLAEQPMRRLLNRGLHIGESASAESVIDAIVPTLRAAVAARAALHAFGIGCIDDVTKACDAVKGDVPLVIKEVVTRSIAKIRVAERPVPIDVIVNWAIDLAMVAENERQDGRGHDIAPIMVKHLGLKGGLANREAIEAVMRSSVEVSDLLGCRTFTELEKRLTA
ncbi:hypothetical protein RB608_10595 [Nocardioides sp. LHD-245]|uniref:hypothetical protein n=1 Tax=Nocardioides sp. LHD-245 TaxID=3051387 RepID=UPI0027E18F9F|nr:hypothetical protein [Nocardioides sp. LHD-245]